MGCGTGPLPFSWLLWVGHRVVAVDPSEMMVNYARRATQVVRLLLATSGAIGRPLNSPALASCDTCSVIDVADKVAVLHNERVSLS
ncbi:class I SAM-dependent methyltransferase [Burkholderia gladioli]|uniref:class I SAM-dependent methyltransferase n=1 Tax=Burkholderia gladioli TaxID=28095 RepID=UPI001F4256BE|nr:class I SAM-dependent methyltransferase [Burkholderia gladioli]